jgi:hypothetical protein
MKPGLIAINEAEQLVIDETFLSHAKMLVQSVAKQNLTNQEKHAKVANCLLILLGDIGETVLEIGIRIAVLWLKSKTKSS